MKSEDEIAADIAKIISQLAEVYNQAKIAPEGLEAYMTEWNGGQN